MCPALWCGRVGLGFWPDALADAPMAETGGLVLSFLMVVFIGWDRRTSRTGPDAWLPGDRLTRTPGRNEPDARLGSVELPHHGWARQAGRLTGLVGIAHRRTPSRSSLSVRGIKRDYVARRSASAWSPGIASQTIYRRSGCIWSPGLDGCPAHCAERSVSLCRTLPMGGRLSRSHQMSILPLFGEKSCIIRNRSKSALYEV